MILVIIHHSILFYTGNDWFIGNLEYKVKLFSWIANWSHSFRMYAFTLVSGYLYCYLRYERGKYQSLRLFFKNKLKRLIVPYIFVSTIWIIPISVYFFNYNYMDIVKKYVLATAPSQLWFLWMLFDVFIIVYPFSDWIYRSNLVGLIFSIICIVIGIVCGKFLPNIFCIWTGFQYIIYFILGFKIRQIGSMKLMRINSLFWIISHIMLFLIVSYLHSFNSLLFKILSLGMTIGLQVLGAIMAFIILQTIASNVNWQKSTLLQKFTQKSMAIFLLHQQIIYFTIYWFNGVVNPYINAAINFVVAVVGAYIISAVMFRYKPIRVLMGEKW